MFSRTSRLNHKPLFLEFSGFYILFSFQGSLLSLQQQLVYLITTRCVCQQLFLFFQTVFLKLLSVWRSFPQREYYNIKPITNCQPLFSFFSTKYLLFLYFPDNKSAAALFHSPSFLLKTNSSRWIGKRRKSFHCILQIDHFCTVIFRRIHSFQIFIIVLFLYGIYIFLM